MVISYFQSALNHSKFVTLVILSGCAVVGEPPVIDRSTSQKVYKESGGTQKKRLGIFRSERTYVVKKGDTLYSIAWKQGLSYGMLAELNNISSPFIIYPGQRLKVSGFKNKRTVVNNKVVNNKKEKPLKKTPSVANNPAVQEKIELPKGRWIWPLNAPPSLGYSKNNKGVDYELSEVKSLRAAGPGSVVYEGGGIGGFENLIIIKHSSELLSAYSFNGGVEVTEQQTVKSGDVLARIKPVSERGESVHFEIRRNGRPIDPKTLIKASI